MANKRTASPVVISSLRLPPELAKWLNDQTEKRGYTSRNKLMIAILEGREPAMPAPKAIGEANDSVID